MKKITFSELVEAFQKHNKENNVAHQFADNNSLIGVIVFKNGPWFMEELPEVERTYSFSSSNKYFIAGMGGNSLFADCLDNTELGVRLDAYLSKWEIDYCYIKED